MLKTSRDRESFHSSPTARDQNPLRNAHWLPHRLDPFQRREPPLRAVPSPFANGRIGPQFVISPDLFRNIHLYPSSPLAKVTRLLFSDSGIAGFNHTAPCDVKRAGIVERHQAGSSQPVNQPR